MWKFDKEKIGYVKTEDFHGALQLALDIKKEEASLILHTSVPFVGRCGSVAYRRWLADFCQTPRVDWQSYLNMNLLATGSREISLQHAEQGVKYMAATQSETLAQEKKKKKMLIAPLEDSSSNSTTQYPSVNFRRNRY